MTIAHLPLKCFFIEQTTKVRRYLRRYHSNHENELKCTGSMSYHDAMIFMDEIDRGQIGRVSLDDTFSHEDPHWPVACECGYVFQEKDEWQLFQQSVFKRQDNQEETTLREALPGAMWFADWMVHEGSGWNKGPDGHCLAVKCPDGHDWMIDSRCSNCDKPDDNIHKCWCRHGIPPVITVDKNCTTCNAGAGSIQTGNWHGFLRNGEFVL